VKKIFAKFKKQIALIVGLALAAGFCITLLLTLIFVTPLSMRDLVGMLVIYTPISAFVLIGILGAVLVPSPRKDRGRGSDFSPEYLSAQLNTEQARNAALWGNGAGIMGNLSDTTKNHS
jgi:hypothetical protein